MFIGGAAISAFTGIPAADFVGLAVAMIGAALACTGVAKKAKSEGVNTPLTYAAIALIGVGSFLLGFLGVPETAVTQIVTVVAGLAMLIAGLVVSIKAKS